MKRFLRGLEEHKGLIKYHSFSDQDTLVLCNHIETAKEQPDGVGRSGGSEQEILVDGQLSPYRLLGAGEGCELPGCSGRVPAARAPCCPRG